MKRVLEPEVMDTEADAEEYDAMDFWQADRGFARDALALLGDRPRAKVIDLGTGTAKIPVLMLKERPELDVHAVDLAEHMLRVAERRAKDAGVALTLARMDVKALTFEDASFDLVVSNSTAHHLADPAALFREIARVVKPRGAILVRDLYRPETEEDAWATVRRVAADASEQQRRLFFDSLSAALTLEEVRALASSVGLATARVLLSSDRHWSVERASG